MPDYQVEFFELPNGTCPVLEFISSLDVKMEAKVYRTLQLLQDNGPALREPYSKHLDDGIFELRVKVSSNITRVLYFFHVGRRVIVTNGFVKKTQRTPPEQIALAKRCREEFLNRKL